jgi:hypothetical protein
MDLGTSDSLAHGRLPATFSGDLIYREGQSGTGGIAIVTARENQAVMQRLRTARASPAVVAETTKRLGSPAAQRSRTRTVEPLEPLGEE